MVRPQHRRLPKPGRSPTLSLATVSRSLLRLALTALSEHNPPPTGGTKLMLLRELAAREWARFIIKDNLPFVEIYIYFVFNFVSIAMF